MKPTSLHLFCGLGGGALGFQAAGFDTLLGVDFSAPACADFEALTGAPALRADLSTLSPDELRAACGGRRPDVVFTSPPCKAFSGCLPRAVSLTPTYQDMSDLSLRGVWLALEAWPTPPPLVILENVPRIQSRGAQWLDQITGLLRGYGYAVRGLTHDCGEIGGLGQRRRRYLLVARHVAQVPEVLYQPPHLRVRGCGEVLGALPVPNPDTGAGGPMHALPKMSALNWLRLALIPAGRDWRALPASVALPASSTRQNGPYGVVKWGEAGHAVVAAARYGVAWASVADPRLSCAPRSGAYGVADWSGAASTVTSAAQSDNGPWTVADPRIQPRREGSMGVTSWSDPSVTVIAQGIPQNGPWQVADPRLTHGPRGDSWGVLPWAQPGRTVRAVEKAANCASSVADPRLPAWTGAALDLDDPTPKHLLIVAADGTWHRPMTTLELAALQGLPVGSEEAGWLTLSGRSHSGWRERIGNAVPPPAAEAVARQMMRTLEASRAGGLLLGSTPVWVQPAAQTGALL